ncbi:MAG: hypothetical protein HOW73_33705, partial [Polyangiaceae bacterium]|nr:hypothetical protein [Polyangiaceae bacterium]
METLAQWIHKRGPLAPKDAVGWAIRLAKHLEALHLHGVAHGNVSPACVLIEQSAPFSRGVVADVRRTAEMVQYHSPERFRNGQLSPSDDAWGLAGTLFSSITGARPFGELKQEVEQRVHQGLPPLAAFGIVDDAGNTGPHGIAGLYAILANALIADPGRRTSSVAQLRGQLEHWFADPRVRDLTALDDEDGAEEDAAATAMLPMDRMVFEESSVSRNPDSLGLFAPPSFDPRSSAPGGPPSSGGPPRPGMATPPRSRPGVPLPPPSQGGAPRPGASLQQVSASPLGEQDATVMRELPAHIMAMAARAVSGSNPPAAPPSMVSDSEPPDDPDFGGATKIAPAPDAAALLGLTAPNPVAAPPPPPVRPPAPPLAPTPAVSAPAAPPLQRPPP